MSRIPDALWPEILPIVRAPQLQSFRTSSAKGKLLWIGADEIVLARAPGTLRIPDAVFRADGAPVLESVIPQRRRLRFKIQEVDSLEVTPLLTAGGTPRCA